MPITKQIDVFEIRRELNSGYAEFGRFATRWDALKRMSDLKHISPSGKFYVERVSAA